MNITDDFICKLESVNKDTMDLINRLISDSKQMMEYIRNLNRELCESRCKEPKVVVPKKSKITNLYLCNCMKSILTKDSFIQNYCPHCGSKMDWKTVAEAAEQEHDYKAVQEAKQANDFVPLDLNAIFGNDAEVER